MSLDFCADDIELMSLNTQLVGKVLEMIRYIFNDILFLMMSVDEMEHVVGVVCFHILFDYIL